MDLKQALILSTLFYFATTFTQEAEIVSYRTDCSIVNNKLVTIVSCLLQINNKSGDDYSDIEIDYKKSDKIDLQEAWIEDIYGNVVRKLKKSEITDKNRYTGYFFTDYMEKTFSLKHNQYPYRVRYTYTITENDFFAISYWDPIFSYDIPVQQAKLTIKVPENYEIRIKEEKINHQQIIQNGSVIYTWQSEYIKQIKGEIFSPPLSEGIIPLVYVVPVNFKNVVNGKQDSWENFSNWVWELNKGLNTLPDEEKKKIDKLIAPLSNKTDKVKTLYYYLQDNNRYINVSIGNGGLKTYPAEYVVKNRYGDCKALSNYMKSMLDYAGIESYYTLINAGEKIEKTDLDFPSTQFNHVIVCVPLEPDTLWLECTSKISPFNFLGTFTQGRFALPVKQNAGKLVKTPALSIDDVIEESVYSINLMESTNANIKLSGSYKGVMFDNLNHLFSNYNKEDQDRVIRYLFNFNNYEVKNWSFERPHRDSANIKLNAELILINYVKNYGKNMIFQPVQIEIPDFEEPTRRKMPVRISYPLHKKIRSHYILPYNSKVISELKDTIIKGDFGMYSINYQTSGNNLTINKEFILFSGDYTLSEYPLLYNFIVSINNIENRKTTLLKQ